VQIEAPSEGYQAGSAQDMKNMDDLLREAAKPAAAPDDKEPSIPVAPAVPAK
jgi:hypothetical protein